MHRVRLAALLLAHVCFLCVTTAMEARKDWEYPFDRNIESEAPAGRVNFFDPRVFNASYYMENQPQLSALGINDTKSARMHWVKYGIFDGLTACANFSARVYLAKNVDVRDMYGADNFPFAVIHYLRVGVHETFRETGGPLRLNVYHPKVFNWRWYVAHNNLAKILNDTIDEETAKIHWLKVGLPKGLQASRHLNIKVYAEKNSDVMAKYDPQNYPAALAHWLDRGFRETWRENGGMTCEFWSRWCHGKGSFVRKLIGTVPAMPTYNSTGGGVAYPPEPVYGGFAVEINGRDCYDLKKPLPLAPGSTRVEYLTHVHFYGHKNDIRKCNVFIRHYTNIQTRVQNNAPPELYLTHWKFDDTVPKVVLQQPISPPRDMVYSGFSWEYKPATSDVPATFTRPKASTDWNYGVAAFRLEDLKGQPTPDFDNTVKHLTPTRIYTVIHHYQTDPNAPISGNERNPDGSIGTVVPAAGSANTTKA